MNKQITMDYEEYLAEIENVKREATKIAVDNFCTMVTSLDISNYRGRLSGVHMGTTEHSNITKSYSIAIKDFESKYSNLINTILDTWK